MGYCDIFHEMMNDRREESDNRFESRNPANKVAEVIRERSNVLYSPTDIPVEPRPAQNAAKSIVSADLIQGTSN